MEKYLTVKYGEEVAARVRTNRSLTVEEIMYCNAAHSVGRHLLAQREEDD